MKSYPLCGGTAKTISRSFCLSPIAIEVIIEIMVFFFAPENTN